VERGLHVRIYAPYGPLIPGMGYLIRRLLENTSNDSFLRHSFVENVPEETLLRNPLETTHGSMGGWEHGGAEALGNGRKRGADIAEPEAAHTPTPPHSTPEFHNEPETDFAVAENRERMAEAIARVRAELGRRYPLVINGDEVNTDEVLTRPNPSNAAEIVGVIAAAGPKEAECAIAAARAAFPAWRDTPAGERADILFRTARVLRRRRFELAAWEVLEVGKPWRESDADVAEAVDFLEYYGREMLRLAEPRRRDIPGERNEYFYEPRGVAAIIAPWNFPLAILTGMTSAALVAGNTVIMKPAKQSSIIASRLMQAFQEAGAPEGVLHYLPGPGEVVGPALVEHPDVALIAFTGSKEVGLGIYASAARVVPGQRDIKRVIAELGGKNAIIIDDDADLDEAVPGVLASGYGYTGQKCSACSRVLVLDSIYDAFVGRLAEAARSVKIGPAEDPGTMVGPVVDAGARNRILRYLNIGRQEGNVLVQVDPGPLTDQGYFVPPTIFTDVSPEACIAREEIFGPVLAVIRVKDLDEALAVADSTLYALTGGLYSRSPGHIARARREFRVGNLYINRKITGAQVDRQPFGGFRMSGIGSKAGGPDYLPQFLVPRTVTESTLRRGFAPEVEV
ncbi:MAG: L-glutamate gamma-semialdehyde dehydrogenase, partial [Armatimonadetes bacterium]|nr:L-glutamate gamma-semialdehyde dehydrogenase [Armatimonadota bacterium]